MTLSTTIKSGNLPVILLGSQRDVSDNNFLNHYPYAHATCIGDGSPIIETVELKNETIQHVLTLWLPLPSLPAADLPGRSLFIFSQFTSWVLNGGTLAEPTFQVILCSRPSRPSGSSTGFTSTMPQVVTLSTEQSAVTAGPAAIVTTVTGISGAAEAATYGDDMQCFLKVKLPAKASGSPFALRWQIRGLAVDQW